MKTNLLTTLFALFSVCVIQGYGQTNWTKYINNPVVTKGPDNFDLIAIGQPTTLFENDTIKMWYAGVGTDGKSRICYAFSLDGVNWTKHNAPVMEVGNTGEWDRGWLDTPEIVKDNAGYKLYYYGDTIQQFSAISSAIGVAFSSDGINWTKHPGNPIFTKGNVGDWDGSWVESPAVVYDSTANEYRMWYNGVDTATWKINIGLALSNDGISWTKHSNNPVIQTGAWGAYDDMWLGTPTVLNNGNFLELWYAATSSNSYNFSTSSFDTVSICYATSVDGINWVKHANNPLFHTYTAPYDSLVDRGGPWAPCVIFNSNTSEYMMWFEADGGNANYTFSLATAPRNSVDIAENQGKEAGIMIYPNPVLSSATIQSEALMEDATLQIYNSIGQSVFLAEKIDGFDVEIDAANFESGMYILELKNNGSIMRKKFIAE